MNLRGLTNSPMQELGKAQAKTPAFSEVMEAMEKEISMQAEAAERLFNTLSPFMMPSSDKAPCPTPNREYPSAIQRLKEASDAIRDINLKLTEILTRLEL